MLYLIVFVGDYGGFFVIVVDEVGRGGPYEHAQSVYLFVLLKKEKTHLFFNLFVIWYSSIWY